MRRSSVLILGLWAVCAFSAPGTDSELSRAMREFERYELDAALASLEAFEAQHGASARSLYTRARIAALRSQVDQARAIAARCRASFPDSSLCYEAEGEAAILEVLIGGNVFELLGAVRTARRAWERAIEIDPDNMRASLLLLRFYREVPWIAGGSSKKAKRLEAAIAARNPAKGEEAAGLNALFDEAYPEAIAHFKAAHAALPADRDPHFYLGQAYATAEDWPHAYATWDEITHRYPLFWRAWLNKGIASARGGIELGAGHEALTRFLDNARYAPDAVLGTAYYGLGLIAEREGDLDAAIAAFRKALVLNEDHELAREALAAACQTTTC